MAKGYVVAHVDVEDADRYAEYVRLDTPVVEAYGGTFLVRGGSHTAPESPQRARHVIIEFDTYERALEFYNSAEYQAAHVHRLAASKSDFIILEGV